MAQQQRNIGGERCAEQLGVDTAFPLSETLRLSVEWLQHLHESHECDCTGWEQRSFLIEAAQRYQREIASKCVFPAPPEGPRSNLERHAYQEHPLYPNYCAFAVGDEDYCKREPNHEIHLSDDVDQHGRRIPFAGVTFGKVKVDIENETETFERIYPPQPSIATTSAAVEGFEDYLPLTPVRFAPGEYEVRARDGRTLWRMEGAALADWVCASVNGYVAALEALKQKDDGGRSG